MPDMGFGRMEVADGESKNEVTVQSRVRQEYLTGPIHRLKQFFVDEIVSLRTG
jgi:hypothetical protein